MIKEPFFTTEQFPQRKYSSTEKAPQRAANTDEVIYKPLISSTIVAPAISKPRSKSIEPYYKRTTAGDEFLTLILSFKVTGENESAILSDDDSDLEDYQVHVLDEKTVAMRPPRNSVSSATSDDYGAQKSTEGCELAFSNSLAPCFTQKLSLDFNYRNMDYLEKSNVPMFITDARSRRASTSSEPPAFSAGYASDSFDFVPKPEIRDYDNEIKYNII